MALDPNDDASFAELLTGLLVVLAGLIAPSILDAQAAPIACASPAPAVADLAADRADASLMRYQQSLAQCRAQRDAMGEATALFAMATVYHRRQSHPDLQRALAYYDSASEARSIGVSAAFRAPGDTASSPITEPEVPLFKEWALAWLGAHAKDDPQGSSLAALAIVERGRAHRMLDARSQEGPVLNLARISGPDPASDGKQLVFWATGLSNAAATLVYAVTSDTLLAWLILPSGDVTLFRQPISAQMLGQRVAAARVAIGAGSAGGRGLPVLEKQVTRSGGTHAPGAAAGWQGVVAQLAKTLLPPGIVSELPADGEVVIVPDGVLGLVPFAMLSPGPNNEFLGARFALRYAPSLSALRELNQGVGRMPSVNFSWLPVDTGLIQVGSKAVVDSLVAIRSAWLHRALVAGNPVMPTVHDSTGRAVVLPPLAGAAAEATWVASKLGLSALTASSAREADVRRLLPTATVVHLATHGMAYQSRARFMDSFIALAPGGGDDGLLTVGEILDKMPRLSADLVVLSACQTGLGNLQEGEGTVGLQYAFLARGARNVLVSLWSVNDAATTALMERFYIHWLDDGRAERNNGPSKSEALRRAQADIRKDPKHPAWANPLYWAGFQLVGGD